MSLINKLQHLFRGDGVKAKILRGASWTTTGYIASQFIRLASNLILTRLLFPEAFGLMALAQVFLQGLVMLSDIGTGPSIIQNKRGDDPDFLATAWTMQVIRGLILFVCMILIAYPASLIYHAPLLFPVLILIGSTAAISGFQSIGFATATRTMALKKLTLIDLSSQIIGIATMILWAWLSPTIWSLVAGGIISAVTKALFGQLFLSSPGNRFLFEKEAAKEVFHFGKWVFAATACTYFGGQGLRLIQSAYVSLEVIGLLSIAGMLALTAKGLIDNIGSVVLFPVFSETNRNNPADLAQKLKKARTILFVLTCPIFITLIFFGNTFISILYDERYHAAGLYLSILAIGAALSSLRDPFGMTLLAVGDSRSHTINMATTVLFRITGVIVGFHYGGVIGMLAADIVAQMCVYPVEAWRLRRHGLWFPLFDVMTFVFYFALGFVALKLQGF